MQARVRQMEAQVERANDELDTSQNRSAAARSQLRHASMYVSAPSPTNGWPLIEEYWLVMMVAGRSTASGSCRLR